MPGNSERRGRRTTSKKGATVGSGGKNRASLKGRGTHAAGRRAAVAQGLLRGRGAARQDGPQAGQGAPGRGRPGPGAQGRPAGHQVDHAGDPHRRPVGRRREPVRARPVGRRRRGAPAPGRPGPQVAAAPGGGRSCWSGATPCWRRCARTPRATALYVAHRHRHRRAVTEIVRTAGDRGVPLLEVSRAELDRMTGGVLHQGVGPAGAAVRLRAVRGPAGGRGRGRRPRCWWRWTG